MYKEPSLSKLSTKSLSKLKNKIDVAFSKQNNNENQAKNMQQVVPVRSNSTKSLAKSKYQSADRNLPFSTTIKNGLMQTERKYSSHQNRIDASRKNEQIINCKKDPDELECKHSIEGEKIVGYSWFHQNGKDIVSGSKKSSNQTLRYFALKQAAQGKQKKRIIAAIEDGELYVGSKKYILVTPNASRLNTKQEAQKLKLDQYPFVMVVDEKVTSFTNLHKLIGLIFQLLSDGVQNIDAITKIIGRRIVELAHTSNKDSNGEVFILLLLMSKKIKKIQNGRVK